MNYSREFMFVSQTYLMVRPYNLARQILKVPKFNCLRNVITDLGICDAEIRRRIGVEKDTF